MLYAAPICSAMNDKVLGRLETIHNSGLRIITGAFHTSPIVSLHAETGIPSLRTLLEQRTAIFTARKRALEEQVEPVGTVIERNSEDSNPSDWNQTSESEIHSSGELWGCQPTTEPDTANNRGSSVLELLELELPEMSIFIRPRSAPWERSPHRIDKSLLAAVHRGASNMELKHLFLARVEQKYRVHSKIYTDGSKTNNRCGYSVVGENLEIRERINNLSSIFTAECLAIKEAVKWVVNQEQVGAYLICTDSLSAVTSLEKTKIHSEWRDEMAILQHRAISRGVEIVVFWVPSHVGIPGNERADQHAKLALEKGRVDDNVVNFKELKMVIKKRIIWRWQAEWSTTVENKLREVKNTVLPFTNGVGASRKDSAILSRLRIGHTALTHAYLLEKKERPKCQRCNAVLTVKHVLTDCIELDEERRKAGMSSSLREVLADDKERAETVLHFLQNIGLYNLI